MRQTRVPIKSLPRGNGKANRAQHVRRVIYDRTIDLFEKKSFRGTSMSEIADACGVTKPAIYHYFRNKMHILEILFEDVTGQFFATMEDLAQSNEGPGACLRSLIEYQTVYNIENRRFLTIFWRERHECDEVFRKALAAHERELEAWVLSIVKRGQATGEFSTCDPKVAMLSILGMLSTVHRWAQYTGKSSQEIARDLSSFVLNGLGAKPTPRSDLKGPASMKQQTKRLFRSDRDARSARARTR